MSTKPNFADLLFQLLPPGDAYRKDDESLMQILTAMGKEFTRFYDWLDSIASSIPDELCTALKEKWAEILGTENLAAKLKERGVWVDGSMVTNTTEHLEKIISAHGFVPKSSSKKPFTLGFYDLPWNGLDKENGPEITRLVKAVIALKHAHLWVTFSEKHDA